MLGECINQDAGMGSVGARQWHQHTAGAPARQMPGAHGFDRLLGQPFDEGQPARDPARVSAHFSGDTHLVHPVGGLELAQQRGLLEDAKLPGTVSGQQPAKGVTSCAGPDLGLQGVQTSPPGGRHTLVAVDEHKTRRFCRNHDNGHQLAAA